MRKTNQDFLNLNNLELTFGSGLLLDATKVSIKRNPIFVKKRVGLIDQMVYNGESTPTISMEVVNSSNLSYGDLSPNDPVVDWALTSPSDADASILQNEFFTKFPIDGWVIGDIGTEMDRDNLSMLTIPIIANCLNPNA